MADGPFLSGDPHGCRLPGHGSTDRRTSGDASTSQVDDSRPPNNENDHVAILVEQGDGVIGVDTHRDTLAAAAVNPIGAVLASTDSPANACGYRRLLDFAREQVPGRRCWALEGIGSHSAGLVSFLDQAGEQVVEVCRPKRATNLGGRKTVMLDAIRAAKEALATEHLIQRRLRGEREALRVLLATRHGAVLASTAAQPGQGTDRLRPRRPPREQCS
ncbi:IS110 family transposase [Streptomyces massasporeus]|uniref:IS110 family transposase n=1 Tax=Streptomyces massasporeus TaxID=67324 RepID=UPI0027E3E459|nr:transposase [Streptomyces massasporeus]